MQSVKNNFGIVVSCTSACWGRMKYGFICPDPAAAVSFIEIVFALLISGSIVPSSRRSAFARWYTQSVVSEYW